MNSRPAFDRDLSNATWDPYFECGIKNVTKNQKRFFYLCSSTYA